MRMSEQKSGAKHSSKVKHPPSKPLKPSLPEESNENELEAVLPLPEEPEEEVLLGKDLILEDNEVEPLVEDWQEIALEEPADLLEESLTTLEFSEDPVRLYLKEIGQINLLDADSEFRLAARIEALRHIEALEKHIAPKDGSGYYASLYLVIAKELLTEWERLEEDAHTLQQGELPDLSLILAEAQLLRSHWQASDPSYLRNYLDNGLWGKDPLWEGLVRHAFSVFISLYVLPPQLAQPLMTYLREVHELPRLEFFIEHMPSEDVLAEEIEGVRRRAEEANQTLIRANLRLVVSIAKRY